MSHTNLPNGENRATPPHNLVDVLRTLFRYKREILLSTLGATALAVIVALLLPVYYESTTIFYAAHTDLASPDRIFGTTTDAVTIYGGKDDVDRLLQISRSGELVNYLVEKFDLYERYDIDSTSPRSSFDVAEKLFGHYSIQKNKYDAIEMTVEDRDPEVAAAMVNAARDKVAQMAQDLIKEGQALMLTTMNDNIREKEQEIRLMSDSLQGIRQEYKLYNVRAQSEQLSTQLNKLEARLTSDRARLASFQRNRGKIDSIRYLTALVEAAEITMDTLNIRMTRLNEGMGEISIMEIIQREGSDQLALDRERYKQYRAAFESDFQTLLLFERGAVPVVKSRPHRSLIVVGTAMVVFVLSILAILLWETYRHLNWRSIVRGEASTPTQPQARPTEPSETR